jgi:hypothetical protein
MLILVAGPAWAEDCYWETKSKRFGQWSESSMESYSGYATHHTLEGMTKYLEKNRDWELVSVDTIKFDNGYSNVPNDDYVEIWLKRKVCP